MGIADYFQSVEAMTPEQVREFLDRHEPSEYNLVDVRQPSEYERMHLPGARLIPLPELADRMNELDTDKPTIAY